MAFPAAYTVATYRRSSTGTTAFREKTTGWTPLAEAVAGDIQPVSGRLVQEEFGQRTERQRKGFFPSGTDLREGDGVQVSAGPNLVGSRWIVTAGEDWGGPGALELDLVETSESFT